jgi:sugar/nucleoside kinase (ribokinase family)
LRYDYTTVGHVTADVMADGSRAAGGTAFYSALQAARLGQRTLIITQGAAGEIEELLEPYRGELELDVRPASQTTTLLTAGTGAARTQRMLAWAGPIEDGVEVETSILHLAPIARETPPRWRGRADFVGLTPQGLVRAWARLGAEITLRDLDAAQLPQRCDAIVVSQAERDRCALLIARARQPIPVRAAGDGEPDAEPVASGAVVAVTAEAAATTIHLPNGAVAHAEVPATAGIRDDLGAGDVFAAAFFIALREGRSALAAASFANAAAAVRISGKGASAIGDKRAIEARLRAVG